VPETHQKFLRRPWVRRVIPAGVATVIVIGGTAVVRTNASASPIDTYRTTTVTTGSVEQRLDLTGSVQRVNQVSQSFPINGTVSGVSVAVGDPVKAGQALAALDPRPLANATTDAQAALAQAKATLESDQTSSTTTTSATTATQPRTATVAQTATPTTSPRVSGPSVRSGGGANQSLARAQGRLTGAQSSIAADLRRASAALAQCASFFPSETSPPAPTGTTTPPPTSTTTPPPTSTTTPPPAPAPSSTATSTSTASPSDAEIKACLGALRTAPTQQQIERDQKALARSQTDLTAAFTQAIATAGNTASASRSGSASQSTNTQSTNTQSTNSQATNSQATNSQSTTNRSVSAQTGGSGQSGAARVVSDQAAVTEAQSALNSATADQASATLKSSIAGTVGSISLATGASSTGKSITIVGTGAVEVTVNVPLASMASVHVGQKANVTPQGATGSVPGTVTSISLLPVTTSGTGAAQGTTAQGTTAASSPLYPVVVLVPDALPALASGARANVSLLIGTVGHVITVPNSALTPLGNGQALTLTFKDGVATRALVKTGYTGTLATQVTSGLTVGQQVVLADLSTALPTNTTNARRFGVGGGAAGGLGGAGLGGAGLGGAGLGGGGGFTPRG
jgi:multidrug efflux pump subunit AcrA (membrane-fusion protein)